MPETGTFQINDIKLDISPAQIKVDRQSFSDATRTLRTQASTKIKSQFSSLMVTLEDIYFTDEIDLKTGLTGYEKLRDLIAQVRVTPFAYIEDEYLRNTILAGDTSSTMVFAIKDINIVKDNVNQNVIIANIQMTWFNYLPYTNKFTYRSDIWLPEEVSDPSLSKAWKLLYEAEKERNDYLDGKIRSLKPASGVDTLTLGFTQFGQISVKDYRILKKEADALGKLRRSLIKTGPDGAGEIKELNTYVEDFFGGELNSTSHAKVLREEVFGDTTSFGNESDLYKKLLDLIDNAISENKGKYDLILNESAWRVSFLKDGKVISSKDNPGARISINDEANYTQSDTLVIERDVKFNFEKSGFVVEGVSAGFGHQLVPIHLAGHAYPTFQHLGGADGVISFIAKTTSKEAIKSLSNFFSVYEDQSMKFRRVPEGKRNIQVRNRIANMIGIRECYLQNMSDQTVPGEPDTYAVMITLVNNPIKSSTQEQLIPSSSFTTTDDIRREVIRILDENITLNYSYFKVDNEPEALFGITNNEDYGKVFRREIEEKVKVKIPKLKIAGRAEFKDVDVTVNAPLYRYTGPNKQKDLVFKNLVEKYLREKSKLFQRVLVEFQNDIDVEFLGSAGNLSFSKSNNANARAIHFLTLTDNDILGVERLKDDMLPLLSNNRDYSYLTGNLSKSYEERNRQYNTILNQSELPGFKQAGESKRVLQNRLKAFELYNTIQQFRDVPPPPGTEEELLNKSLSDIQQFAPNKAELETIISKYFDDWNNFIIDFIDDIIRNKSFITQFRPAIEMSANVALNSGSECYPDFPLRKIIDSLATERPDALASLKKSTLSQNVVTNNISITSLVNPDFYLYNAQTDTLVDMIPTEVINKAVESVYTVQKDKRFTNEDNWFSKIYKNEVLGVERSEQIQKYATTTVNKDQSIGANSYQKILSILESTEEGKAPSYAKDSIQKYKQRVENLAEDPFTTDDFYNDATEPLYPSLAEKADLGQNIEVKAIELGDLEKDRWLSTSKARKNESMQPDDISYQAAHILSASSIEPLPENFGALPQNVKNELTPQFVWPTGNKDKMVITSFFNDIRKGIAGNPHNGIDIGTGPALAYQTEIRAAADGEIVWIEADESELKIDRLDNFKENFGYSNPDNITTFGKSKFNQLKRQNKAAVAGFDTYEEFRQAELAGQSNIINNRLLNKPKLSSSSITIKHGNTGFRTKYKHIQVTPELIEKKKILQKHPDFTMSAEERKAKLTVRAGQAIGLMGNTGRSTGPHLHFEIYEPGKKTSSDPARFIDISKNIRPKDRGRYLSSVRQKITDFNVTGLNPRNDTLLTKSVEQFKKDILKNNGYSIMRAYPAFKLYFIESDLGERKVYGFDDFFSYSAVQSINLIRTRKLAADLLHLRITNTSGVFSNKKFKNKDDTEDFDGGTAIDNEGKITREGTSKSNFKTKNTAKENPITRLMLQPGTQVQLRLGYNNNPDELEKVFNGMVVDSQFVENGDFIEIVCQSFGVEFTQVIQGEVKNFGGFLSYSGQTSILLEELLTNPEVVHFGRWEGGRAAQGMRSVLRNDYKFQPKPQDDNIFAPTGNKGIFGLFDFTAKYIMYKQNIWDVFQEMTLRHPGYIAYPVPYDGKWGPRMTMFFGVPDQLYFHRDPTGYELNEQKILEQYLKDAEVTKANGLVEEENLSDASKEAKDRIDETEARLKNNGQNLTDEQREAWIKKVSKDYALAKSVVKPFRNYHVLTSSMHIIKNNISSSSFNTFNSITVQYGDDDPTFDEEESGELQFGDVETFNVSVDAAIPDEHKREGFGQYPNCVGVEMAKRYGISLLWRSQKDGYKGTIEVTGNPSIKPHDICYLFDDYTDMFGPIEVEQVVHSFSLDTGFTTIIVPDMMVHVNQESTLATSDAMGMIAEHGLKKIGLRPLATILDHGGSVQKTGDLISRAEGLEENLVAVGSAAITFTFAPLNAVASMFFNSSENSLGIDGPTTPFGISGSFIFSKLIARSQTKFPFRYSALTLHGRPMIGGAPIALTGGSFIRSVEDWFSDLTNDGGLFIENVADKMNPHNWLGHQQGDFLATVLGQTSFSTNE